MRFSELFQNDEGVTFLCPHKKVTKESGIGERSERCLWQKKRTERVAAVDKIEDQLKPEDFIGHRNRSASQF